MTEEELKNTLAGMGHGNGWHQKRTQVEVPYREIFSAIAMHGLLSADGPKNSQRVIIGIAVQLADALIAELDKGKK